MKSRLWQFTNFNLEFDYKNFYEKSSAEYIAYALETCPKTGREHHQGFVYFNGQRGSIKGVARDLGGCHVEMCKGNIDQNEDYCSKESQLITYGIKPSQGKRTDINAIKNQILDGKKVDDITIENPTIYHQYGRTLNQIEDIALRKKYRSWMTEGYWYHGATGTGKSHKVFEGFSPETHYVYPNDNGWWDGYKGQETVIINEFRGGIQYSELLDLVDKWPKTVKRRGREPVPFLAKKLYITSSMSPVECYSGLAESDPLNQLYRRFKVVQLVPTCRGTIQLDQKYSEGNTETSESEIVDNPE